MQALRVSLLLICLAAGALSRSERQDEDAKQALEEYIQEKKTEINHRYRLHYHVAAPVGWINDPNGFSFYKGQYHLFYQFYPYDSVWGPMHWGHVTSPDLVHWETQPTALLPGKEQCFSGSAVVDGDEMILMYTGHEITEEEPFYYESQYLAYSDDGVNFYKYEGNPVIAEAPNQSPDFRDPKAWKHEDHWYVVLGSKTEDSRGRVLLYRSEDLKEWEFLTVLAESDGYLGYMWECPDFFELGGKFVLLWSPQGMQPEGDRYKNLHQTGYIIGSFDYETFEFVQETQFQEIDFGHDFYAAQTTERDGKRYLVAWFNMWEQPFPEAVDGWAGAMTLVRELKLEGDRILMTPVEEIVALRQEPEINGDLYDSVEFQKAVEMIVRVDTAYPVNILIEGMDGGSKTVVSWDPEEGKVAVDRDGNVRQVEWTPIEGKWRIFLDASSLELFCGLGEVVFSTRVYPEGNWKVTNLGVDPLPVQAWSLSRSVPE